MAGFVMRNAVIEIDDSAYQGQLKSAELTPDADSQTYKTLDPDSVLVDVDSNTWTFKITGPQDHDKAKGLARYLTEHHGQSIAVTLTPKKGGYTATFEAIAKAVPFGGEQGSFAEFDVELPVVDQPEFTDPDDGGAA